MEVLILLVFISLVLVAGAVVLFLTGIRGGDFEHAERLSLLPLEDDERTREMTPPAGKPEAGKDPAGGTPTQIPARPV